MQKRGNPCSRRIHHCGLFVTSIVCVLRSTSRSRADQVVQLINGSTQRAADVLNSGSPFVTSFRGTDDLTITLLSGTMDASYEDTFPASNPGHSISNPDYLSHFVGSAAKGTGDVTIGTLNLLQPTGGSVLQFDFSKPLAAGDHFLIADVDNGEHYVGDRLCLGGRSLQPGQSRGLAARRLQR